MSEKISQMPSGTPAQTTDIVPVVRGGVNYQVPLSSVVALAPAAPNFEINGTPNSSQAGLNFESTDGTVTITNPSGEVINLSSPGAVYNTPGQGFFWGAKEFPVSNPALGGVGGQANQVTVAMLILTAKWTISKVAANIATGSGISGSAVSVGIYSFSGNLLLDCGVNAFNAQNSANPQVITLGSPVTLNPGVYWFAWAPNNSSTGSWVVRQGSSQYNTLVNLGATTFGKAANALSGGQLPSTLGAITAYTSSDVGFENFFEVKFQV